MLSSRQELENTRRKLELLRQLIARRELNQSAHPAGTESLRSLRKLEHELQQEIAEFEQGAARK